MYMHTSENFELFQQLSLTTSKFMRDVTYILIIINDLFLVNIEIVMNKVLLIS